MAKCKKKLKGISLPIEMIIIIAIAVLVLVVIAAFFVGGAGKLGTTNDASAFGEGCQMIRNGNCAFTDYSIDGYRVSGDAQGKFSDACKAIHPECKVGATAAYGVKDSCCLKACGCP